MSDVDLVFNSTHGLTQTITFNGLPGQNVAVNLDMSSVADNGDLGAGYQGAGSLTIQDGVAVASANGFLGYLPGSTGTATVSGAGSAWTTSNSLYVGYSGSGNLSIANGGNVNNTYYFSGSYIGYSSGSSGTVTVDGAARRGLALAATITVSTSATRATESSRSPMAATSAIAPIIMATISATTAAQRAW